MWVMTSLKMPGYSHTFLQNDNAGTELPRPNSAIPEGSRKLAGGKTGTVAATGYAQNFIPAPDGAAERIDAAFRAPTGAQR
jgi:hypothetical protein